MTIGLLSFANPAVVVPASLLKIILVPDSNWSGAPQWYQDDAIWAANAIMAAFPNTNITLTIEIGYQFLNNGASSVAPGNSAGNTAFSALTNYSALKAAMAARTGQPAAFSSVLANLPTGTSISGATNFSVNWTTLKALGMFGLTGGPANANDTSKIDGSMGIGSGWSSAKTKGVFLHEFTHCMGRDTSEVLYGFSRFSASGVWDATGVSSTAFFSTNGGVTNLATYAATSDMGDFDNGTTDPGSGLTDCFNIQQVNPAQFLSPLDITLMNAMGVW